MGELLQKVYRKRRIVRDRYDEAQARLASLRALERASTTSSETPNLDAQHPSPPPPPLTRVPSFWVTTWSRNVTVGTTTISNSSRRSSTNHRGSRNSDSQPQRRSPPPSASTRTTTTATDNGRRRHDENDTTTQ
jgi:hypothetical protein